MLSIFVDFIEKYMDVFIDHFIVYENSFDKCLESLDQILAICIEKKLVLNFEKYHFMIDHGTVLGHFISSKGIEVDK